MEAHTYAGTGGSGTEDNRQVTTECGFKNRSLDWCSSTNGRNRSRDRKTGGRGPRRAALGTILPLSASWLVIKPAICRAQWVPLGLKSPQGSTGISFTTRQRLELKPL